MFRFCQISAVVSQILGLFPWFFALEKPGEDGKSGLRLLNVTRRNTIFAAADYCRTFIHFYGMGKDKDLY